MLDIVLDALLDSLGLLPFLFVTYAFMEYIEHKLSERAQSRIEKAGSFGPLFGGLIGLIPQCGFSTAAASLYIGKIITPGTLMAVFLSTSDEMLPILISENIGIARIAKVLGFKMMVAVISGLIVEIVYKRIIEKNITTDEQEKNSTYEDTNKYAKDHEDCACHENHSMLKVAVKHSIQVFMYILIISIVINVCIYFVGENVLGDAILAAPSLGKFVAALVGLIPNCASSIVITEFYLRGIISAGSMMAGLLVNAGVGLLVLFRDKMNVNRNLYFILALYCIAVFWGFAVDILAIRF